MVTNLRHLISFTFLVLLFTVGVISPVTAQANQDIADLINIQFTDDEVLVGNRFTYVIKAPFGISVDQGSIPIDGPAEHNLGDMSTSSRFQSINGRSTSSTSIQLGLNAKASGHVTVGPVEVIVNGEPVTLPSITTKIVGFEEVGILRFEIPEYGKISHPQTQNVMLMKQLTGNYFSSVGVPEKVFEGQAFPITTYFYQKNDSSIPNLLRVAQYPSRHESFLPLEAHDMAGSVTSGSAPHDPSFYRTPLCRDIVLPIKTGTFEVSGYSFVFGRRVGSVRVERVYEMSAPSNTVEVQPLPPVVGEVNGTLVGKVTVGSKISSLDGEVGDLVTLEVMVSGEAYLKPIVLSNEDLVEGLLHINTFSDFSLLSRGKFPIRSKKKFQIEYQLLRQGELTIPPFRFAVFNPKTETYSYQNTSEYTLHVTGEKAQSKSLATINNVGDQNGNSAHSNNDQAALVQIPKELAPLLSVDDFLKEKKQFRLSSTAVIVPNIILAVAGFFWYLFSVYLRPSRWYQTKQAMRSNVSVIEAHLRKASESAHDGNADAFYQEIVLVLRYWLLEKKDFDFQSHDLEWLKSKLPTLLSSEKSEMVISLLRSTEEYRFSPNPPASQLSGELEMLIRIVQEEEKV